MVKRTGPTNPYLRELIKKLKEVSIKENVRIWKRVAELLERPRRKRVEVNLNKIEKCCKENEIIIVPGVVLATGNLSKPVKIAAWRFSENAKRKILEADGKIMEIEELLKENPKGSNVRIMV